MPSGLLVKESMKITKLTSDSIFPYSIPLVKFMNIVEILEIHLKFGFPDLDCLWSSFIRNTYFVKISFEFEFPNLDYLRSSFIGNIYFLKNKLRFGFSDLNYV